MLKKVINPNAAYKVLCMRIEHLLKHNDKRGIEKISKCRLFYSLTDKQKEDIMELQSETAMQVSSRLSHGEISPMMLNAQNKTRDTYIRYIYFYIIGEVLKSDPEKAKKLAGEVRKDICLNPLISDADKDVFCDEYFEIIYDAWRKSNAQTYKEKDRFLDRALQSKK